MPHKIKTLKAWFEEVWVNGNLDAIPELLAPNARTRGIMGDIPFAADEMAELVTMVRAMLGPIEVSYPVTVQQDDWLSALVEVKSYAIDTGDPVHVSNQFIARFDAHRMVEIYSGVDSLTLFEQLGLLPTNAMAVMLGGTALR
ncbi:nuclear transport factor 2 family protein [Tateyamaria sp.]|uniref:nuclear transport factor 2 family protein n=1 Tax=Tateyamaria sp. TaxID=1929288 RepID=UPI00329CA4D3